MPPKQKTIVLNQKTFYKTRQEQEIQQTHEQRCNSQASPGSRKEIATLKRSLISIAPKQESPHQAILKGGSKFSNIAMKYERTT